jgi:hypothetical protein
VLGSTFPAEALIAVSGRDEPSVRAALADLVRREVLRPSPHWSGPASAPSAPVPPRVPSRVMPVPPS